MPGPQKVLRWGFPDSTRGPNNQQVHNDLILADSLAAVPDKLEWTSRSPTIMIRARDPLAKMDSRFQTRMTMHLSGWQGRFKRIRMIRLDSVLVTRGSVRDGKPR